MEEKTRERLHKALLALRDSEKPGYGICRHVYNICATNQVKQALSQLLSEWPDRLGGVVYPIERFGYLHQKHILEGTIWDRSTEHGARRWALLEWLIEQTAPEAE